jgi:outer membrane biogenesis lipoprotein LolB
MTIKIYLIAATLLLAGCQKTDQHLPNVEAQATQATVEPSRFDLKQVGQFEDYEAYTDSRTIYILTDKQTGQQFVGVSGIGISELGSHPSGKSTVSDER